MRWAMCFAAAQLNARLSRYAIHSYSLACGLRSLARHARTTMLEMQGRMANRALSSYFCGIIVFRIGATTV